MLVNYLFNIGWVWLGLGGFGWVWVSFGSDWVGLAGFGWVWLGLGEFGSVWVGARFRTARQRLLIGSEVIIRFIINVNEYFVFINKFKVH